MKNQKGFTLIELLVSLSLFVIIISIAAGGFSSALRSQRQAIALMNVNNNISLVLEQMMREIRTGYDFCQNQQSQNSCTQNKITFKNAYGQTVSYQFNNNGIERDIGGGFKKITADNVVVEYLNFIISGQNQNDKKQPRITILIGIRSTEPGISSFSTKIQTTVSPRILDS